MSHKDDINVLSGQLHRIIGQLCELEDDLGIIYDELSGQTHYINEAIDKKSELKPCPFCGGEAFINLERDCRWAECRECGAMGYVAIGGGEAEAAESWNKRAEQTCSIIDFDDGVDEGIDGEWHQYAEPQYDLSCGHSSQGAEAPNYCPECGAKVMSE